MQKNQEKLSLISHDKQLEALKKVIDQQLSTIKNWENFELGAGEEIKITATEIKQNLQYIQTAYTNQIGAMTQEKPVTQMKPEPSPETYLQKIVELLKQLEAQTGS